MGAAGATEVAGAAGGGGPVATQEATGESPGEPDGTELAGASGDEDGEEEDAG